MEAPAETRRAPLLERITRASASASALAVAIGITYVVLPLMVFALGVEHEYFLQLAEVSALGAACIWVGFRLPFVDRLVVDDAEKRGVDLDAFQALVWGAFVLFVVLVVATAERIPFVAALQGAEPETVAMLRERFLKAREGWQASFVYVNALLAGTIVPYALALMLVRRHRWRWVALGFFTVFCLSFVEKVFFLKAAVPVLYLVAQRVVPSRLKPRTVLVAAIVLLGVGTVAAGSGTLRDDVGDAEFFTTGFAAQGPLSFVAWRAVAIPVLTAADALRVFQDEHGGRYLLGASSSMLAGLLGVERVNVERQVFAAQFGEAETGTGSANSVYVTEAFVNFGWLGVVLFSMAVGLILRIFAASQDEALRSLWMLFAFGVFVSTLTGTLLSNGFLFVIALSLLVRFDEPQRDQTVRFT
jgi:hypothetical protein